MTASVPKKGDQYIPSGELQGDDYTMADRGTSRGVTDTYGADLSQSADNRIGSIRGATRSDGKEFA